MSDTETVLVTEEEFKEVSSDGSDRNRNIIVHNGESKPSLIVSKQRPLSAFWGAYADMKKEKNKRSSDSLLNTDASSAKKRRSFDATLLSDLTEYIEYIPHFIPNPSQILINLEKEIEFEQGTVVVYNKEYKEPRLTSLHGDDATQSYKYASKLRYFKPMTPTLQLLQDLIEEKTGKHFNFVLVNKYRDGNDKIGLHSDKEDEMDIHDIVSISLGAERIFRVKRKNDGQMVWNRRLENGSMVRMKGDCQKLFKHEVPKEASMKTVRLNLTFRNFIGKGNKRA